MAKIRMAAILYYGDELTDISKTKIANHIHGVGGQDVQILEFTPSELEEFRKHLNRISCAEKQEICINDEEANGVKMLIELVNPINGVLTNSKPVLRALLAEAFGDAKRRNVLIKVLKALGNSSDAVCDSFVAKNAGLTRKLMEVIREANSYYITE